MRRSTTLLASLWALSACGGEVVEAPSAGLADEQELQMGQPADAIFGQPTARARMSAQTNAGSLEQPFGVTTGIPQSDQAVPLFVADPVNRRVLGWRDVRTSQIQSGEDADLVIGQPDMFVRDQRNVPGAPINQRITPLGVALGPDNRLYVMGSTTFSNTDADTVIVFEDPFGTDTIADYQLRTLPALPSAIRFFKNNERVVVVGASDFRFYRVGESEPMLNGIFGVSCPGAGADVAEVASTHMLVACTSGEVCPTDPADCLVTPGVSGACVAPESGTCGSIWAYPMNTASFFPDMTAGRLAYNGFSTLRAVQIKGDKLFTVESAAHRVLRFNGVAAHLSNLFVSMTPTPLVPYSGAGANFVWGQTAPKNRMQNSAGAAEQRVNERGLSEPRALSIDPADGLWVSERTNHRVMRFPNALDTTPSTNSATVVLGQAAFDLGYPNRVEERSFVNAQWVAIDPRVSGGRLYVADTGAHRVVFFNNAVNLGSNAPGSGVLGQPDLLDYRPLAGAATLSASNLNGPTSVAIDLGGRVYVTDGNNNRVLRYDGVDNQAFSANQVYGVADVATAGTRPMGPIAVKGTTVFVGGENRIFMFTSGSATPARVIGQPLGDLVSNDCNRGIAPGRDTFCGVSGMAIDDDGALWVADSGNNRVLRFLAPEDMADIPEAGSADAVVGQVDFASNALAATDRFHLSAPMGLAVDSVGRLWVADSGNNRVLMFPTPTAREVSPSGELLASASLALGQASFTGNNPNAGGIGAHTLAQPRSVAVYEVAREDSEGFSVFVADHNNARVLRFTNVVPLTLSGGGRHQVQAGTRTTFAITSNKMPTLALIEPHPAEVTLTGTSVTVDATSLAIGTELRFNVAGALTGPPAESATVSFELRVVAGAPVVTAGKIPEFHTRDIDESCACTSASPSAGLWLALAVAALLRRRRA